jgi:conjugative relaxase-like TrwC/TraI family protein
MSVSIGTGGDFGYYARGADDEHAIDQAERAARDIEALAEMLHDSGPRATDYAEYLLGQRELDGVWKGRGAERLGLTGKVKAWQGHRLYGKHENPHTGKKLGKPQVHFRPYEERLAAKLAKEPFATEDRKREIELSVSKVQKQNRMFYDATFSLPKEYSLLHASLLAAGREEEAQKVVDAHHAAIDECMKLWQDEQGYSRRGRAGCKVAGRSTGEYVRAQDWVYSQFDHRTSRCGDMNLHTHVLINSTVECPDDGVWRAIYMQPVFQTKRQMGALHERLVAERVSHDLGVRLIPRANGFGWTIEGITQDDIDLNSSRRRAIEPELAEKVSRFVETYGREPTRLEMFSLAQDATLKTRPSKPHERSYAEYIEQWDARYVESTGEHLADLLDRVPMGPPREPTPRDVVDRGQVIQMAIAMCYEQKATWGRQDLRRALSDLLPPNLGRTTIDDLREYLDSLVDEAVRGELVDTLHQAPAVVPPASLEREPGVSIYEPPNYERYSRAGRLGREDRLTRRVKQVDGPRLTERDAALLLDGTTLYNDQRAVAHEVLTSGRRLMLVDSVAGSGKTYTEGRISDLWFQGMGVQVVGLSKNNNAAEELARAGVSRSMNFDRFRMAQDEMAKGGQPERLAAVMAERYGVNERTLLIVDEITTLNDEERFWLEEFATRNNVSMLWVGDRGQVQSVGANATLDLVAAARPPLQLDTARRFRSPWEREASVGLHDGLAWAIVQYERHGRIYHGTREEMDAKAEEFLVADIAEGRNALLMVPTTALADEKSSYIRQRLIELGIVDGSESLQLHNDTCVSVGDMVQARKTLRELPDRPGESISNRDLFHVKHIQADGSLVVVPHLGHDENGAIYGDERVLPAEYVRKDVELGYVTTVHSKIGRTVERSYALGLDPNDWHVVYTAMTRGAESNVILVPVAHDEDGRPIETGAEVLQGAAERHREGLGDIERASATEALRQELDGVTHLARLGPIYENELLKHAKVEHEDVLRRVLGDEQFERMSHDEEAAPLYRLTRALEREGHDVETVVREAVEQRELESAESIAKVLHTRIVTNVGPSWGRGDSRFVDAVPEGDTPELNYVRAVAEKMDERVVELGQRQADAPEPWAVQNLGPLPSDPVERLQWLEKAGAVAAYREQYGQNDPERAIEEAPGRHVPEQRAAWERAYDALGRPAENEDVARLSDGELLLNVERQRRIEAWLPPDVSKQLENTSRAARDYEAAAALDRARGQDESAALNERLAASMKERAETFERVHAVRREAEARYAAEREAANASQLEYERRHPTPRAEDEVRDERTEERTEDRTGERQRSWTVDEAIERADDVSRHLAADRAREQAERSRHEQQRTAHRTERSGHGR